MSHEAFLVIVCVFMILWSFGSIHLSWMERKTRPCAVDGLAHNRGGIGLNRESKRSVRIPLRGAGTSSDARLPTHPALIGGSS